MPGRPAETEHSDRPSVWAGHQLPLAGRALQVLTRTDVFQAAEGTSKAQGSWPPAWGNPVGFRVGPPALSYKSRAQGEEAGPLMGAKGLPLLDIYYTPGAVLAKPVLFSPMWPLPFQTRKRRPKGWSDCLRSQGKRLGLDSGDRAEPRAARTIIRVGSREVAVLGHCSSAPPCSAPRTWPSSQGTRSRLCPN